MSSGFLPSVTKAVAEGIESPHRDVGDLGIDWATLDLNEGLAQIPVTSGKGKTVNHGGPGDNKEKEDPGL